MALRCSIGAVIAACSLIIPLTAQPSQQAFEVASVKRAAKPGRLTFPVIGNGLFNVPSTTAESRTFRRCAPRYVTSLGSGWKPHGHRSMRL